MLGHLILEGNALIRFFFKVDPKCLSIDDWAERYQEVVYLIPVLHKIIWGESKE